jgi:hypothetical protein
MIVAHYVLESFSGGGGFVTDRVAVQEVIESGNSEMIREKMVGLLRDVGDGMGVPITIYCAQLCAIELERQAVERLDESSKRLERLTKALLGLTVVLALLALPPALEVLKRLF